MKVTFLLNGETVEVETPASQTLLDWLRGTRGLTGTKEGCNEGDCGACSVIVTDETSKRALNACILFMPQLHGKSVRTVEGIAGPNGEMHPVQSAMVDHHGSQCGFCTPGFIASMAAGHANGRTDHDDMLAGNLCRCTGYAPILDAASKACGNKAALKLDDSADVPLLKEIQRASTPTVNLEGDIIVQPVVRTRKGNEFVSPATLAEVADYLVKHPTSTLLAGSTEVGLQVNKQFSRPDHIVYLGNVVELKEVKDTPNAWHIGAVVSLTEVEGLVAKASRPLPNQLLAPNSYQNSNALVVEMYFLDSNNF